jgi:ABC-2 type transport system ATP-binding protein
MNSTESQNSQGIVVKDVVKTYKAGKVKALDQLSLIANSGEALGIIGPNGAGKTTLFGCLLAFLKVDSGSITIDGLPPDALETRSIVGYLPERLNFDKWMTGRQFMQFHYELAGLDPSTKGTVCDELLTKVALEQKSWDLLIKRYSRGMLQRLGFAQALLGRPRFLLLDEPASGVDPAGVLLLRRLMRELKAEGMTIILNSHQLEQVEKLCDRVVFIKHGKVDAVEDLKQGHTESCRYIIKWKSRDDSLGTAALDGTTALDDIATRFEAELIESQNNLAVFNMPHIDAVADTLAVMIEQGFRIIEATPQDNRLERFFVDGAAKTADVSEKRPIAEKNEEKDS